MSSRHFEAVIFSAKAAVAALIAAVSYKFFDLPGAPWVAAVSAVLVTQPDLHSSFKASLLRVVANLAGAFGGAALLAATGQPILAMVIGVLATGLVCYLLKQDDALRPAFVAVIIVTLIGGGNEWHSSRDRVAAVIIGCVCALTVGFLFDKLSGISKSAKNKGGGGSDASE
ncbi:MAG TPA: FUSC family protein [Verrucomicrobiae bacterium]